MNRGAVSCVANYVRAHEIIAQNTGGASPAPLTLDYGDPGNGTFSLRWQPPADGTTLSFKPQPWAEIWQLDQDAILLFAARGDLDEIGIDLALVDGSGRRATTACTVGRAWTDISIPFIGARREPGFDHRRVTALRVSPSGAPGTTLWLDGLRFVTPRSGQVIGITADSLEGWIHAEKGTRAARVAAAFRCGTGTDFSGRERQIFDLLWTGGLTGSELAALNGELRRDFEGELSAIRAGTFPSQKLYDLMRNPRLIAFYCCFGAKGNVRSGALGAETEHALLELLWERTKYKNDIAVTRTSTWWMTGSENHDLNTKVCNLIASRIFMEHSGYADRVFPDPGYGDGAGYGAAGYYGRDGVDRHGGGRADLSDRRQHTAREHYEAWVRFLTEYFRERGRRGFFLENAACGYMKWSIGFVLLLHCYSGNDRLKRIVGDFLDLFWTEWALLSLSGLRGGAKTRHHNSVGGEDSMTDMARFYLGGTGKTEFIYPFQLLSDYSFPEHLWQLILEKRPLGEFAFVSRGIGEEQAIIPRPPGTERTMMCDTESRFVKYAWVTPEYILGTQMDHPHAVHSHLSATGRWQGLITHYPGVRLVMVTTDRQTEILPKAGLEYGTELLYRSVQCREVLITQQAKTCTLATPDWFPEDRERLNRSIGIFVGTEWERMVEREGWIFCSHAGVFGAIRPILVETDPNPLAWALGTGDLGGMKLLEDTYTWSERRTVIKLKHNYSPVIIEAGLRRIFGSFESFMDRILANRLALYPTVVPRHANVIVVYRGASPYADELVFNGASKDDVPTIGGEYVNYAPEKLFDSPFMESVYRSGRVSVRCGVWSTTYDFNQ